ncbi:hypothetical protein F0562_008737 [Nyssa sinensis]|uniref:HMA domain-containing protein n=1 Tax=Nyssa sinensis TaxID=561372 RepID=A0A5J5A9Y7_9ASTE|nr:hypothetical protein F0562_008737 [Nyssa sinensis]
MAKDSDESSEQYQRYLFFSPEGISNFRMDEDGMVEVSGTVDPSLLMKMLAKAGNRAELCWFQFGQCSSNLFIPDRRGSYGGNGYYEDNGYYGRYGVNNSHYGDDRYLHYGSGYSGRPRAKHWYRPFQLVPSGTTRHDASVRSVQQPPLTGEDINCCSLM